MPHGNVRWFNDAKGYGVIESDEVEEAIYVHFTELRGNHETLRPGDTVRFAVSEEGDGDFRHRAVDVRCDGDGTRRLYRG